MYMLNNNTISCFSYVRVSYYFELMSIGCYWNNIGRSMILKMLRVIYFLQYSKLNEECGEVGSELNSLMNEASELRLSEADRLKLTGLLRTLCDRHARLAQNIAARIAALGQSIDSFKQVRLSFRLD